MRWPTGHRYCAMTPWNSGLVDRIGFRDEAYARIAELVGVEDVSDEEAVRRGSTCRATPVPPGRELRHPCRRFRVAGPSPRSPWSPCEGSIVNGRGGRQFLPFGSSNAGADTIAAALREVAADDAVSAIVLRVDSPGGSVTASETIWREVKRARERGKPVVASMGAMAASGGYYVSMDADAIVANPGTITGSIGVISGKLVVRDLKERLGVGSDTVRTNANADVWSVDELFTPEQQAHQGSRGGPASTPISWNASPQAAS